MSATSESTAAELLKKLGVEGWSALDPNSQANAEQRADQARTRYERARTIAAAFTDEKGRAALQALREQTYLLPTWQMDARTFLDAIGNGVLREGQNSLVRWVERQIEIAEQGPSGSGGAKKRGKR